MPLTIEGVSGLVTGPGDGRGSATAPGPRATAAGEGTHAEDCAGSASGTLVV